MHKSKLFVIFLISLAVIIGGCISKQSVKKGDRLVVLENLRESAETQWEDSYTDGFVTVIPKGTILEVLYSPRAGSNVIECLPVEVNGSSENVEEFFVPEHIRNQPGYKSYVFALKSEYLGEKIKKAEAK